MKFPVYGRVLYMYIRIKGANIVGSEPHPRICLLLSVDMRSNAGT